MNKWLVLPLLALLTACVSYYQPESALEDGVYYPEDDPSYRYNPDDYYSRVVYYPWASLDYFYFGYWPYPSYGFSFVYPYEFGFAAWGYPYSYYGYYAYYSPWYSPWYATYYHDPYWRPYRRHCHHGQCPGHGDDRDAGDDRYAGTGAQGYPGGGGEENAFYSHNVKSKTRSSGYPPTKRYVSKTPAWRTGYQGMAARSVEPDRSGGSRTKPAYPLSNGATMGARSAPAAGAFSGRDRPSPSFSSPSHSRSSAYGKSARQRDRD